MSLTTQIPSFFCHFSHYVGTVIVRLRFFDLFEMQLNQYRYMLLLFTFCTIVRILVGTSAILFVCLVNNATKQLSQNKLLSLATIRALAHTHYTLSSRTFQMSEARQCSSSGREVTNSLTVVTDGFFCTHHTLDIGFIGCKFRSNGAECVPAHGKNFARIFRLRSVNWTGSSIWWHAIRSSRSQIACL